MYNKNESVYACIYIQMCTSTDMYESWVKDSIYMYMIHSHCSTLQHTATNCNTLQHTATHCNTLQHTYHPHDSQKSDRHQYAPQHPKRGVAQETAAAPHQRRANSPAQLPAAPHMTTLCVCTHIYMYVYIYIRIYV